MKNMVQVAAFSVMAASIALTGCSAKRGNNSEVVVAPMGMPSGSGYYNGGAVSGGNGSTGYGANGSGKPAVYFDFNSSEINSAGAAVLNSHAQSIKANPSAHVVITGNTDERGSNEYNMALGERRAKAAQAYLAAHGVPASRTEAVSNGEDQPADPGHDEAAWSKNRRDELAY